VALLALAGAACAGDEKVVADRVLLVTIDTLRADRLGCYGDADAHTRNLDTLAGRGVRFDAAISPAPLTLPAHASLLTALDPPQHGVRHNGIHRLGDEMPTLAERLRGAGLATAAFVGSRVLDRRFGLDRGFDVYDDRVGRHSGGTVGYAERRAGEVVDAALAWLAGAPPRWFAWVHVYDPHAAYAPPPGFAAAFGSRPYAGEIAYVDHALGRLFEAVGATDPASRRLVVAVTSDHGESLGEHGEPTHSYGIYDATQRVPLILAGAGLPEGRVVDATVRLVDLAPTLLALADAPPLEGARGRSLLPLLRGEREPPRLAYLETLATHLDFGWSPLVGVRDARWKYIRAPRPELYDLERDPAERTNRAAEHPDRAAALDARLEEALAGERTARGDPRLGPREREQLRALGYVVPSRDAPASSRSGGPDPKDEKGLLVRMSRAETLAERGDPAAALEALRGDLGRAPGALALRAALAVRADEPDLAERDARAVLAREPAREDVWVVLGQALEARGELAAARRAYRRAAELVPDLETAWRGVARAAEGLGDAEGAARARGRARGAASSAPGPAPMEGRDPSRAPDGGREGQEG